MFWSNADESKKFLTNYHMLLHVLIYHASLSIQELKFCFYTLHTVCDVGRNKAKENYEETSPWFTFIGNLDLFQHFRDRKHWQHISQVFIWSPESSILWLHFYDKCDNCMFILQNRNFLERRIGAFIWILETRINNFLFFLIFIFCYACTYKFWIGERLNTRITSSHMNQIIQWILVFSLYFDDM